MRKRAGKFLFVFARARQLSLRARMSEQTCFWARSLYAFNPVNLEYLLFLSRKSVCLVVWVCMWMQSLYMNVIGYCYCEFWIKWDSMEISSKKESIVLALRICRLISIFYRLLFKYIAIVNWKQIKSPFVVLKLV